MIDNYQSKVDSISTIIEDRSVTIDSLKKINGSLSTRRDSVIIKYKTIKESIKVDLNDKELVDTIVSQTPYKINHSISLPQSSIKWLYESKLELDILTEEYKLVTGLYEQELRNYKILESEYDSTISDYQNIILLKNNQIDLRNKHITKLENKLVIQRFGTKLVIVIAIGGIIYAVVK